MHRCLLALCVAAVAVRRKGREVGEGVEGGDGRPAAVQQTMGAPCRGLSSDDASSEGAPASPAPSHPYSRQSRCGVTHHACGHMEPGRGARVSCSFLPCPLPWLAVPWHQRPARTTALGARSRSRAHRAQTAQVGCTGVCPHMSGFVLGDIGVRAACLWRSSTPRLCWHFPSSLCPSPARAPRRSRSSVVQGEHSSVSTGFRRYCQGRVRRWRQRASARPTRLTLVGLGLVQRAALSRSGTAA